MKDQTKSNIIAVLFVLFMATVSISLTIMAIHDAHEIRYAYAIVGDTVNVNGNDLEIEKYYIVGSKFKLSNDTIINRNDIFQWLK